MMRKRSTWNDVVTPKSARLPVMLGLTLLIGCGPSQLTVSTFVDGCSDFESDVELVESIEVRSTDLYTDVVHFGAVRACDATESLELSIEGTRIEVQESWTGGDPASCAICWEAVLRLKEPPTGTYEVAWYVEDSVDPLDTVEIEID